MQHVLEAFTDVEREKLATLGFTGDVLWPRVVEYMDVMVIARDVATRAFAQINITPEVDPITIVIQLEVAERPFEPELREFVQQRLQEAV